MLRSLAFIAAAVAGIPLIAVAGLGGALFGTLEPFEPGALGSRVVAIASGYSGVFLLDAGAGRAALIDAGVDPSGTPILDALSARKLDPGAVDAIFLTHGHRDHVAALDRFGRAEIYALEAERDLLEGRVASRGPISGLGGKRRTPIVMSRALADGETVRVGDLDVRVYAVPGHTAGSAAYLAAGVLFLGDSADADRWGHLQPAMWIFTDSADENRQSLVALAGRLVEDRADVRQLAFAHSGHLESFAPLGVFAQERR